jgi:hypothetical protein
MVILYIYLTCWHMKSVFYERQQQVEDQGLARLEEVFIQEFFIF